MDSAWQAASHGLIGARCSATVVACWTYLSTQRLAGSPKSASLARGCTVELLDDLLRAGFATVATGTVGDGDRTTEIACVTITEAGWRALEGRTDTE